MPDRLGTYAGIYAGSCGHSTIRPNRLQHHPPMPKHPAHPTRTGLPSARTRGAGKATDIYILRNFDGGMKLFEFVCVKWVDFFIFSVGYVSKNVGVWVSFTFLYVFWVLSFGFHRFRAMFSRLFLGEYLDFHYAFGQMYFLV